jgi:3',5'-cyclic-AMP phosphodiesterase
MSALSRREAFLASVAGITAIGTARGENRRPSLRAAHITDVHILNERKAPQGVLAMFAHMFGQKEWTPELVLNTGDTVMGVDGKTTAKKAAQQIAEWKKATANVKVPIKSCLGNHDVWDGMEPTAEIPVEKKGFGLMTGVLGMPAPYYSFDHGGWHFVSLNSLCDWPKYATLNKEQMDWLIADLKKTPATTPVCVLSHVPILSVTSQVYGEECRKGNDNLIPSVWQHGDCWRITEVFRKHPNVKLCLSGHMHTCDRCEYRGVWYICGGAVSGAWWDGAEYGFPPMYGQIDFFADGTFEYRFTDYGWEAKGWKGKTWPA